ncbi:MAG: gliding motility lipoprotein GldH [Bacteroidales bacterium]|nr:gliding motility lipoprotein GldH [Bacteroidales bacterium]
MKRLANILILALLMASCADDSFEERTVIPEAEWAQQDRVAFDVDINDTINGYAFGIELRHLENYRYSNLFVFLHTRMPNGNLTHDTIECTLATPEGRWIGKSSGSMRDLHVPLNENLRFPLTGTYHFEIEQAMREPVLKGISDIGLFIEKQ